MTDTRSRLSGLPHGAKPVALVMQGGGALGAYEWGAVTRLCKEGYYPVAVAGVSIGAVNAAAIAGARDGDVVASLKELWGRLINRDVFDSMPWFAPLGNRAMYRPRMDVLNCWSWTAYCDVTPLRRTLEEVCDFEQINDPRHMGFAVTATEVATGVLKRFLNKGSGWTVGLDRITPDHVLASGALPPGFPMAFVKGKAHWDGGLFDNTPVRPMIDLLDEDQADHVPIVQINLFPDGVEMRLPGNMTELWIRKMELTFENRFWDDYAGRDKDGEYSGKEGLRRYAEMICQLRAAVPHDSPIWKNEQFQRLLKRRCLGNLHVITSEHDQMTDGIDFSARSICARYQKGCDAVGRYLDSKAGKRLREYNAPAMRVRFERRSAELEPAS